MNQRAHALTATRSRLLRCKTACAILGGLVTISCYPSLAADDTVGSSGPASGWNQCIRAASLRENAQIGTTVLDSLAESDRWSDFRIEGGNDMFCVDPATGRLLLAVDDGLDFEKQSEFELVVSARRRNHVGRAFGRDFEASLLDAGMKTEKLEQLLNAREEFYVTVQLQDVNEAPVVNKLTVNIPETSAEGTILGHVDAFDPDAGDQLRYSIITDNAESAGPAVSIDSKTGTLTIADATQFDFERFQTHELTVQVEDRLGRIATNHVSIQVTDVNEPPVIIPMDSRWTASAESAEAVGTIAVHDPDNGHQLAFDISDDPTNGGFAIDSATGIVSILNPEKLRTANGDVCQLTVSVWDDACNCVEVPLSIAVNLPATSAPAVENLAAFNAEGAVSAEENEAAAAQTSVLATAKDVLYTLSIVSGLVWVFALLVVRGKRNHVQERPIYEGQKHRGSSKVISAQETHADSSDVASASLTATGTFETPQPEIPVESMATPLAEASTLSGDTAGIDEVQAVNSDEICEEDDFFDVEAAALRALTSENDETGALHDAMGVSDINSPPTTPGVPASAVTSPTRPAGWLTTSSLPEDSEAQYTSSLAVACDPKTESVEDVTAEVSDSTLLELLEASRTYAENEPAVEDSAVSVEDLFAAVSERTAELEVSVLASDAAALDAEAHPTGENVTVVGLPDKTNDGFPYSELSDTVKQFVRPEAIAELTDDFGVPEPATEPTVEEPVPLATYATESSDTEQTLEECDEAVREHLAALFRRARGEDEPTATDRREPKHRSDSPSNDNLSRFTNDPEVEGRSPHAGGDKSQPITDGLNDESRRVPREMLRSSTPLFRELAKRSADAAISTASQRRSQLATKPRLIVMGLLVLSSVGVVAGSVLGQIDFGSVGKLLVLATMASMVEFSHCVHRMTPTVETSAEVEPAATEE